MTQPPPNPQQTGLQSSPPPVQQSPPATTRLGLLTKKVLSNILEVVDQLLWAVMGKLGRTVYGSIQDAIALSILLTIPGFIGELILGKNFSSYDICLLENALGASRYACYIIVTSKFLLWIVIAGRIIIRFWKNLKDLIDS
ncbi:MAG: hypothetical protein AB4352_00105 [Hormoscilla sp.]